MMLIFVSMCLLYLYIYILILCNQICKDGVKHCLNRWDTAIDTRSATTALIHHHHYNRGERRQNIDCSLSTSKKIVGGWGGEDEEMVEEQEEQEEVPCEERNSFRWNCKTGFLSDAVQSYLYRYMIFFFHAICRKETESNVLFCFVGFFALV